MIVPTPLRERAVHEKLDFFGSGLDLALILDASTSSQTLPDAFFDVRGRLWALSGRFRDVPRTSLNALGTLLERSWMPRGVPRASRDRFGLDFGCLRASPRTVLGSIFARYCTMLRSTAQCCTLLHNVAQLCKQLHTLPCSMA